MFRSTGTNCKAISRALTSELGRKEAQNLVTIKGSAIIMHGELHSVGHIMIIIPFILKASLTVI